MKMKDVYETMTCSILRIYLSKSVDDLENDVYAIRLDEFDTRLKENIGHLDVLRIFPVRRDELEVWCVL